jgi:hypothetical protein
MARLTENENSTKYWSSRQEAYIAKKFGGYQSVNSGAGKFAGGDVVLPHVKCLVECKTAVTEKSSFSIKKEWLDKIRSECFAKHQDNYVLAFNYGAAESPNYFILDEMQFAKYLDFLEKEYYSKYEK